MNGAETRDLGLEELEGAARSLLESDGRMQMAYAVLGQDGFPGLRYLSTPENGRFEVWRCELTAEPPEPDDDLASTGLVRAGNDGSLRDPFS